MYSFATTHQVSLHQAIHSMHAVCTAYALYKCAFSTKLQSLVFHNVCGMTVHIHTTASMHVNRRYLLARLTTYPHQCSHAIGCFLTTFYRAQADMTKMNRSGCGVQLLSSDYSLAPLASERSQSHILYTQPFVCYVAYMCRVCGRVCIRAVCIHDHILCTGSQGSCI